METETNETETNETETKQDAEPEAETATAVVAHVNPQIAALPDGWWRNRAEWEQVEFACELPGCSFKAPCNRQVQRGDGKRVPALYHLEIRRKEPVLKKDGRQEWDRDGYPMFRYPLVKPPMLLHLAHSKQVATASREAAKKEDVAIVVNEHGLYDYLRTASDRRTTEESLPEAKAFFTAYAKGEAELAKGLEAGFLASPDERRASNLLIRVSEGGVVASVPRGYVTAFLGAKEAEHKSFSDLWLHRGSLREAEAEAAKRKASHDEWKAREAARADKQVRREEADKQLIADFSSLLSGVRAPKAASPVKQAHPVGQKRKDKRDGPKPRKPETAPSERKAISDGLREFDADGNPIAPPAPESEVEAPRDVLRAPLLAKAMADAVSRERADAPAEEDAPSSTEETE